MPVRKKSETVQLKLRFKEDLRADVERAAKRRGISMNAEIVERIESGTLMSILGRGTFEARDISLFAIYVSSIKQALAAACEDENEWLTYAKYVRFPLDAKSGYDADNRNPFELIPHAVNEMHKSDAKFIHAYNQKHGVPDRTAPRRGEDPEEWRSYFEAADRYKRVTLNRERRRRIAELDKD